MAARLVSDDVHVINSLHRRVVDLILEKDRDMDAPTREGVIAMIVDTIHDIQEALTQPAVRIRADPNIQNPAVDEGSSLNALLARLRNQIKSAGVLADMAHIGPPANNVEANVLNRTKDTMRNLYDNISPVASLQ